MGGLLAAGAAWLIGKTALGLRSDYLAIATLGIAEIIIAVMKNEDWLGRGVKNVNGLPRPVPYEIDLQNSANFVKNAEGFGLDPVTASTLFVKLGYSVLFTIVLVVIFIMAQAALKALGPNDARHPRQRSCRSGDGQERHAPPLADFRARLGGLRDCRGDAYDA